nr:MAG: hypothetical protein [Bacteriophage sp.]UWG24288.1 MAG: hypothetical protein [Bacteriophage sp.]
MLAARFGGTPWAWRRESEPSPEDWGTCLELLEKEREAAEEAEQEAKEARR